MKQEEKYCGNCCWFYAEDTYGYGACPFQFGEMVNCGDKCKCKKEFVSKDEMKHHRYILLQHVRSVNYLKIFGLKVFCESGPSIEELNAAIEFANKYIKIYSRL